MKLRWVLFLLLNSILFQGGFGADTSYEIKLRIKNYKGTVCYLGYPYGDKKYLTDTAEVNGQGEFVFSGSKALDGGLYFIYAGPPSTIYFDLIVAENNFSIETDSLDLIGQMKVKGSLENQLFFDFQRFMREKQKSASEVSDRLKAASDEVEKEKLNQQLIKLDSEVKSYRDNLIQKNSQTFAAHFIKSTINIEVPESPKDSNGKEIDPHFGYHYYKAHYFDNVDFSDARMLRTPNFYSRIEEYMEKMTVKHPDSIIASAHVVIEKARANKEVFRYCVVNITHKYETSNIMGMDAVFVDLAENYYLSGDAFWADAELISKIQDRVNRLKPNLLGKPAPKMVLLDTLLKPFSITSIKTPFTVLYFYDPDCGHCKKKTPQLRDLYNSKLKSLGVTVVGANIKKDVDEWKKYIRDLKLNWINLADPNLTSNFRFEYNIDTTPQIYILNDKKNIIAKKLDVDQVEEFIRKQIEIKASAQNAPG